MKKKIGYTCGSFDLIHRGHINILRRAKENCDYLIVGINSDETMKRVKGKDPVIPYEDRKEVMEAIRYVDEVVKVECPGTGQKADDWKIRQKADIVFSGDDHKDAPEWKELIEYKKKNGGEVKFFKYTDSVSSTKIREKFKEGL